MTAPYDISSPAKPRTATLSPDAIQHIVIAALTLCAFAVHGYHPFAEDGGLYVAGVQSALNPALFPHDLPFVDATRHYSLFTPLMAAVVRTLHIPLLWVLLLADLAGTWLMLYAAWRVAAQCFSSARSRLYAAALIAAWLTLPIAGTSLLLIDPYVTARTFSTPFSLLAIACALGFDWDFGQTSGNTSAALWRCGLTLAIAAAFHPLMAAYAGGFILTLLIAKLPNPRLRAIGWLTLTLSALVTAGTLQATAPAESASTVAASFSRNYWFLSQWQWFELLGLAGPLIVLALLLRFARTRIGDNGAALSRTAIAIGLISTLTSALFAQARYSTHLVARVQPLRAFLPVYAVMIVLLGGLLYFRPPTRTGRPRRALRIVPTLFLATMAGTMFFAQRQTYPASQHLELPWRAPSNPWSRAFAWARENTPTGALFAIDSNYITTDGEDGQTFRATAQRSILSDFSKDGGASAVRPSLTETWFQGQQAQKNLSRLSDAERRARLQTLGVTWLILHSNAPTSAVCPYANDTVKVCPLLSAPR